MSSVFARIHYLPNYTYVAREHRYDNIFRVSSPFIANLFTTTMATRQARRALVLYGSETGNAQDVAEELGKIAQRLRFDTEVAELDAVSLVCAS